MGYLLAVWLAGLMVDNLADWKAFLRVDSMAAWLVSLLVVTMVDLKDKQKVARKVGELAQLSVVQSA